MREPQRGRGHGGEVDSHPSLVSVCVCAQVSQLRHELSMKDELLQFYTSAAEESEPESACSTP